MSSYIILPFLIFKYSHAGVDYANDSTFRKLILLHELDILSAYIHRRYLLISLEIKDEKAVTIRLLLKKERVYLFLILRKAHHHNFKLLITLFMFANTDLLKPLIKNNNLNGFLIEGVEYFLLTFTFYVLRQFLSFFFLLI